MNPVKPDISQSEFFIEQNIVPLDKILHFRQISFFLVLLWLINRKIFVELY